MSTFEIYTTVINAFQVFIVLGGFILAYKQVGLLISQIEHQTLEIELLKKESKLSAELFSRQNALGIIARYSEESFVARRIGLIGNVRLQKDPVQCGVILNFFEELAIAIKHNSADETMLKDYFQTTLRFYFEQDYIKAAIRFRQQQDVHMFENIALLYDKWKTEDALTLEKQRKEGVIPANPPLIQ